MGSCQNVIISSQYFSDFVKDSKPPSMLNSVRAEDDSNTRQERSNGIFIDASFDIGTRTEGDGSQEAARGNLTRGLQSAASDDEGPLSTFNEDSVRQRASSVIADIDEGTKCAIEEILDDDGIVVSRSNTCETTSAEIVEINNVIEIF